MTYGTLFQSSSRRADQCGARTFKRAGEFCGSSTATCRGLWDVYATSVSIFASSATTTTTGRNPGTKDTFHCQVSSQRRYGTSATRNQSTDVFGRSRSTRNHGLSSSGRAEWLNGDCQPERSNWNTVLIVYSSRNYHKLINCWYLKIRDWLTTQ